jgi:hypothetical protein
LVLALVLTFVLVLTGANVLWKVGALCGIGAHPAAAHTAAATKVK